MDIKDLHSLNKQLIFLILDTSQIEMSGIDFNEMQLLNILFISVTPEVFHFEILGTEVKCVHPENR